MSRKSPSNKWVLCHGVYDILHPGHLAHLRFAKGLTGKLVVSVSPDIMARRGPDRPVFSQYDRIKHLRNLEFVDEVYACNEATCQAALREYMPWAYVKGFDTVRNSSELFELEAMTCREINCLIILSPPMEENHSSDIVRRIKDGH